MDQQNAPLIPVSIAINPLILVTKYHAVIHKVLPKIQLRVGAVLLIVLLILLVCIALIPLHFVVRLNHVPLMMVHHPTQTVVPAWLKIAQRQMVSFAMQQHSLKNVPLVIVVAMPFQT